MKKLSFRKNSVALKSTAVLFASAFGALGIYLLSNSSAATVNQSRSNGNWSDASTWTAGRVPNNTDTIVISPNHSVVYNVATTSISGLTIEQGAELKFPESSSATMRSTKNIVVRGAITAKPSNASVIHEIAFEGIDETRFVGGGMDPVESDIGLWVMGSGKLDIAGSQKTPWRNLAQAENKGDTQITLDQAPVGWRVGDELAIAPTIPPTLYNGNFHQDTLHAQAYDETTIVAISGTTVTLAAALKFDHPTVTFDDWNGQSKKYGAEVMNLSRNVKIHGERNVTESPFTPNLNGRSHIFIHSNTPQYIRYAEIYNMTPRRQYVNASGKTKTDGILGRYALHFHHSDDGARGSMVEGNSIHHAGGHAYVPHESHGVTLKDNIAHDVLDTAYWWDVHLRDTDEFPVSHGILLERNIASKVRTNIVADEGYRMSGFELASGNNETNIARDNIAVGVYVEERHTFNTSTVSGFVWGERSSEKTGRVWQFEGNMAHNIGGAGAFGWQNSTSSSHIIDGFTAYHNGSYGVDHGAYSNYYQYHNMALYGNRHAGLNVHATSRFFSGDTNDLPSMLFSNVAIDGGNISTYGVHSDKHRNPSNSSRPTQMYSIDIKGVREDAFHEVAQSNEGIYDIYGATVPSNINLFSFETGAAPASRFVFHDLNGTKQTFTVAPLGQGGGTAVPAWNANRINNGATRADYTPPKVTFTSPTRGTGVRGNQSIAVDVTDAVGVQRVEFYINHQLVSTDTTAPYSHSWNVSNLEEGKQYEIAVLAFDAAGNRGQNHMHPRIDNDSSMANYRTPITGPVTPPPPPPPPVSANITAPTSGSTISGTTTVRATTSNTARTALVEFEINGTLIGSDSTSPYETTLNTISLTNGTYVLVARVTDSDGDESTSSNVSVEISNTTSSTPEDLNRDGVVNVFDLSLLLANWGSSTSTYDINGDGVVNVIDLSRLLSRWGR